MTQIKICGLKRIVDASYVNEACADYAGFVFWDRSSRNVTLDQAKEIRKALNDDIKTVGVFVNADENVIIELVQKNIISCVQLHGTETEEDISDLRTKLPTSTVIIKAFEVTSKEDVIKANESTADMVLIDSGKGSGKTFDWNLLKEIKREYFLAGGLSVENVGDAVSKLHPCVVDVSSKVETDGFKDKDKIDAFCKAVRNAEGGCNGI